MDFRKLYLTLLEVLSKKALNKNINHQGDKDE